MTKKYLLSYTGDVVVITLSLKNRKQKQNNYQTEHNSFFKIKKKKEQHIIIENLKRNILTKIVGDLFVISSDNY